MRLFWTLGFVVVGAAMLLMVVPVEASIMGNWFSGYKNQSSDNSAEFFIDLTPGGPTGLEGSPLIQVGDVLIAVSDFGTNENTTLGGPAINYVAKTGFEPTLLVAVEVTSTTAGLLANGLSFAPISPAIRAILGGSVPVIGAEVATWDPRTLAALYEDPTPDYSRGGVGVDDGDGGALLMGAKAAAPDDSGVGPFLTEDGLASAAFLGDTKLLEVGFIGVGNEYFSSSAGAPLDINVFELAPIATILAGLNFGANLIPGTNLTGWNFTPVANFDPLTFVAGFSDFNASGSLLGIGPQGAGPSTPFDLYDNIDVVFFPINPIPEPSSMLIAFGFLAFAGIVRPAWRRRK